MAEYIREVEKIIDAYHKQNPLFSLNRKTALYNALSMLISFMDRSIIISPLLSDSFYLWRG